MDMAERKAPYSDEDSPDEFNKFISQGRSQKFELLVHLINNLTGPFVVSGPKGIGKSTFLKHLVSYSQKGWEVCHLNVTANFNLNTIQKKLLESTGNFTQFHHSAETAGALTTNLGELSENNRLLVLILDDAGNFEPGLLKTILEFVATQPALRLVFSLRPDSLHIKTSTDYGVESCHFIDIPPLNKQHTEKYLRMPPLEMSEDAVTPDLVAKIYRHSHGVPGNINSVVSKFTQPAIQKRNNLLLPIVFGTAVLIAIAMSYFLWKSDFDGGTDSAVRNILKKKDTENYEVKASRPRLFPTEDTESVGRINATKQNRKTLDDLLTGIASTTVDVNGEPPLEKFDDGKIDQKTARFNKRVAAPLPQMRGGEPNPVQGKKETTRVTRESKDGVSLKSSNNQTAGVSTPKVQTTHPENRNTTIAEQRRKTHRSNLKTTTNQSKVTLNDQNWLLDRNPQHFTLQLMASTNIVDLQDFVAKHPQLKPFGYYRVRKGKTDWYRLLYGEYPSLEKAKSAALKLPSALRKAWPRRLKTVQKEIH